MPCATESHYKAGARTVLGIEPRTSRTLSENNKEVVGYGSALTTLVLVSSATLKLLNLFQQLSLVVNETERSSQRYLLCLASYQNQWPKACAADPTGIFYWQCQQPQRVDSTPRGTLDNLTLNVWAGSKTWWCTGQSPDLRSLGAIEQFAQTHRGSSLRWYRQTKGCDANLGQWVGAHGLLGFPPLLSRVLSRSPDIKSSGAPTDASNDPASLRVKRICTSAINEKWGDW